MSTALKTRSRERNEVWRPANIWTDVPMDQAYVVVNDMAIHYRPNSPQLRGFKHRCGYVVDLDGNEIRIQKFELTKKERYFFARGGTIADMVEVPGDASETTDGLRTARRTVRSIEERIVRVRETYDFRVLSDHGYYVDFMAIENGTEKHEVTAIATEVGLRSISCTCEAAQNFDEYCVHCVRLDEWIEEIRMANEIAANGTGTDIVKARPNALAQMFETHAPLVKALEDQYGLNRGQLALACMWVDKTGLDPMTGLSFLWVNSVKGSDGQFRPVVSFSISAKGWAVKARETGKLLRFSNVEFAGAGKVDCRKCKGTGELNGDDCPRCDGQGKDFAWTETWDGKEPPYIARTKVWRNDEMDENGKPVMYCKPVYYHEKKKASNPNWISGPINMMAVRADFASFERAFADIRIPACAPIPSDRVISEEYAQTLAETDEVDLSAPHDHHIVDGDYRDEAPRDREPARAQPQQPVFADNSMADIKRRVQIAANASPDKTEWFAWIKSRGTLDYGQLSDLLVMIEGNKTPWVPENAGVIEADVVEPGAPSPTPSPQAERGDGSDTEAVPMAGVTTTNDEPAMGTLVMDDDDDDNPFDDASVAAALKPRWDGAK